MKQNKMLDVQVSLQHVGTLHQTREGVVWWTPDAQWVERGQKTPVLGRHFLLEPDPIKAASGLPPWFENLLPEKESVLRSTIARSLGVSPNSSFSILRAIGHDLPGAVVISDATRGLPKSLSSITEQSLVAPSAEPELRFSLAGMQLKLSMSSEGTRMMIPAKGVLGNWIIKLPGSKYQTLPQVEHTTMSWAQASGLEVPEHFVIPVSHLDGLPEGWGATCSEAFAISRFDREKGGGRIHHEDFCQSLNVLPHRKYGDVSPKHIHFDNILQMVVDVCGREEGERFARRLGFMIASGNDDAHLKNWSFQWGTALRPTLSPCYDQVSTIAWPAFGWSQKQGPTLALTLGGDKFFGKLTRASLERLSQRSGQPWAAEEVIKGIKAAGAAWATIGENAPEFLVSQLEIHWKRTPLLRDFQLG